MHCMISWLRCYAFLFLVGLLSGCGDRIKTVEAENNGYICSACQTKFYTENDVFAVACPKCKSYEIKEVVNYLCSQNHVTVGERGKSVKCSTCGASAPTVRLPQENTLKNWGANKVSKSEVSKQ